jgi:opacity protein-like surface antigen
MKTWTACAVALALAAMAVPAKAQLYLSGSAGYLDENRQHGVAGGLSADADFHASYIFNAALGFRIPFPSFAIRVEGEGGYGRTNLHSVTVATPGGGTTQATVTGTSNNLYTGTINGFLDVPVTPLLTPYVGGGLGVAHSRFGAFRTADVQFQGGHEVDFLWLAEAGLAINFGNLAIVPAYRYLHFNTGTTALSDSDAHVFKLGLRLIF